MFKIKIYKTFNQYFNKQQQKRCLEKETDILIEAWITTQQRQFRKHFQTYPIYKLFTLIHQYPLGASN